jgi:hypothetical protein
MPRQNLAVGQLCPVCGTPAIASRDGSGGYCKPCYVQWKNSQPVKPTNYNPQIPKPVYTPVKETDWDKISWGKCKHAYLVETYKMLIEKGSLQTVDLNSVELNAEKWAAMSMRKLPTNDEITYDGPAF